MAMVICLSCIVILLMLVSTSTKIRVVGNVDKQPLLGEGKKRYLCVPELLLEGRPDRYSVMALLVLKFLFASTTSIPRANLALILEAKYSTSIVSVGYLNSLQALVGTLTGFAVGPVGSRIFRNDSSSMAKGAGLLKAVSTFRF
jgi:hypothetical protein